LKELESLGPFSIELSIDRDTKNEPGTPDITESLFKKIDHSKIFIADISIINYNSNDRKTPNPNVLIELGYAARVLGWEKVICIYNADFGSLKDLPFDLRQRRPIVYSLNSSPKATVRTAVSKAIVSSINNLHSSGSLFDSVNDYLKVQVDTEILTIINHLRKIVWNYTEPNSFKLITKFMNLTDDQIKKNLKEFSFIGFQIFKKLEVNERNMQNIVDKVISSPHHGKEIAPVIIDLIRWTGGFDNFNRSRTNPNLFIPTGRVEKKYKVVRGLELDTRNTEFPDRFILLKIIDEQHGIVEDFGDFVEHDKIEGLTKLYTMNPDYIELYLKQIRQFIKIGERWLDLTNGEFIIENNKMFEIKTVPNGSFTKVGQMEVIAH
jgi:hypothetical protein